MAGAVGDGLVADVKQAIQGIDRDTFGRCVLGGHTAGDLPRAQVDEIDSNPLVVFIGGKITDHDRPISTLGDGQGCSGTGRTGGRSGEFVVDLPGGAVDHCDGV